MANLKDMSVKYIRYSLVSTIGFLLSTAIFFFCSEYLGWLSWFVANIIGGVWAFLAFYFKINIYHARKSAKRSI